MKNIFIIVLGCTAGFIIGCDRQVNCSDPYIEATARLDSGGHDIVVLTTYEKGSFSQPIDTLVTGYSFGQRSGPDTMGYYRGYVLLAGYDYIIEYPIVGKSFKVQDVEWTERPQTMNSTNDARDACSNTISCTVDGKPRTFEGRVWPGDHIGNWPLVLNE